MNKLLKTKLKNVLTLVSILMMVALVFPGATIDNQDEADQGNSDLQNSSLGDLGLGDDGLAGDFCGSNPTTNTEAAASVSATYNGNTINNGGSQVNGQTVPANGSNYGAINTFTGTQLHITMVGSTSPVEAGGSVRATIKVGNQTVFDQTVRSDENGGNLNLSYDVALGNEEITTTVVSTACNNVSTGGQITHVSPANGFDLSCGVDQIVETGTNAFYPLHAYNMATVWSQQPLEVDVTSSPAGVDIPNLPLIYQFNHMWTAEVNTSSLVPNQQYTLTFSAQNPAPGSLPPVFCYANLTVTANLPTVDLKFNGSDGPTTPTPSNGDTGELSWTTTNADSCEADMVQGVVDEWKGAQNTANTKEEKFTVKDLKIDNTYEFKLTCKSSSGEEAEDTVVVTVGEPQSPTGEFYCEGNLGGGQGQDSCSVSNGSSALLFWSTAYTESCSLDPEIKNYTPGTNEKKGVSTGALSSPPSSVVYTLSCLGIGGKGKYEDTVTINISSPIIHADCAPSPLILNQLGPAGVITVNVNVENQGSLEQVDFIGSFQNPAPANSPAISYADNPLKVPGVGSVILTPTKDTTLGTYIFQIDVSAADATPATCFVTVIIEGEPPHPPFSASARADIHCESVTVTWEPPITKPVPENYQVYRSLTDKDEDYSPVGAMVPETGAKEYSMNDDDPMSVNVTNYYGVKSVIGSQSSSLIKAGGVIPTDCAPSLNQSDKDLFGVDNNFSDPTKCNNTSDSFVLPNSGIFRAGSKVWFRINVCNTGNDVLTGIVLSELGGLNLTSIQYEEDEKSKDCVEKVDDIEKIILKDLPGKDSLSDPASVCSVMVSAVLKANPDNPNNTRTQLYRFWNQALITSNELPPKVVSTPQYLYSLGGLEGVPIRGENSR